MRTDEDVLRKLMIDGLDGDAAAHATLLRMLVPPLRGFYRRRVRGTDDDVEDLVQETLIAVHTRRSTYDRNRVFGACGRIGFQCAVKREGLYDHVSLQFRRNMMCVMPLR